MSKISFVYFDVGGVAIQDFSDSPKWDQMMKDMGLDQYDRSTVDAIYNQYEDEICLGRRHVDTLIPLYVEKFDLVLPPDFSMQTYFIDHFDANEGIWPIAESLKQTAKIGLLTDQYPGMLKEVMRRKLLPPLDWDQVIDSSVEGVRKPMPEIYELARSRAGFPAEEILFIDNRQKNLDVPKSMGWQTYLYDSSNYEQANSDLAKFIENSVI